MKALVISGGAGTRLRPLTSTTTKQLLPVANRPILHYIMDLIKVVNIKSTTIIVSPEWKEQVKQSIGDGSEWGTEVDYVTQEKPAGLAHAVKIARESLGDSPFLMILGDNVYRCNIKDFVAQFNQHHSDALLLLKGVENPPRYGIATLNSEGKVLQLQEKPKTPKSNLALAGIYVFSSAIHEAIDAIKPSNRGELEITDAIQKLVEQNKEVRGYVLDGWWLDTGDKNDMLKANRVVLEEFLKPVLAGKVDAKTKISGSVEIGQGTIIENSVIQGPSSIASDCVIKNASIGPFASIGPGTTIEDSSIENSIILEKCRIVGIKHISDSLIGKNTKITKSAHSGTVSILAGDNNNLEL